MTTAPQKTVDISSLILRAAFLTEKEKYMWIRIAKHLPENQLLKLADIFLDEENKRNILLGKVKEVNKINAHYVAELEVLNKEMEKSNQKNAEYKHSRAVQNKLLDQLGDITS